MVAGVYKITNKINGKFYIGASVDIKSRWRDHRREGKKDRHAPYRCLVQRGIREDGIEHFVFEILEECACADLIVREQHYLDTLQPAYNVLAKSVGNAKLDSDKRKAYAERIRGAKRDPAIGQKVSAAQKGVPRYHTRGKPKYNNKSGYYGISWRSDQQCFFVRIKNKKYGSFTNIDEALKRRDEVLLKLGMTIPISSDA